MRALGGFFAKLRAEGLVRLFTLVVLVAVAGGPAVYLLERRSEDANLSGPVDAMWWAFISATTVGYGERYPVTPAGRAVAVLVIITGMGVMAFVTAKISSMLVEQRIREGKGLEELRMKEHFVICGWNEGGRRVIEALLFAQGGAATHIALVNALGEMERDDIKAAFPQATIRFVAGDPTSVAALRKAELPQSRACIILADSTAAGGIEKTDERTLLVALAVKEVGPRARTCAELVHGDNVSHLKRARVDRIIVRGDQASFLLASAACAPGIPELVTELFNMGGQNDLVSIPVPADFRKRSFGELGNHFRQNEGAILIALVDEDRGMDLDDILHGEDTFIDGFIRRKFEESGKDFFGTDRKRSHVQINPPDDMPVADYDRAIVIRRRAEARG